MKKLTLLCPLLLAMCIVSPAWSAPVNSGFLDDYSLLQPDADRPGALAYRKEGFSLKGYSRIAIEPVEIFYSPDSKYQGIAPDKLKIVADTFRELVVRELEPAYPVVDSAGEGVLVVRIAITHVNMVRKKRSILSFTPTGFALRTLMDVAGATIILDDAIIEAELIDATSGESLAMLVDQQKATATKGKVSWDRLEEALTFYAKRFRSRLDADAAP